MASPPAVDAPPSAAEVAAEVRLKPAGPPRLTPRAFASLVLHLTRRQLAAAHHLTLLGWAWPIVRQLVQLAVLVFVFSTIFDLGIENYPVFVFIGLLAWSWFSAGLSAAATSVIHQRHLVNQPHLPNATLPISAVGLPLVDLLSGLPILAVMLLFADELRFSALLCLPIALVQLLLLAGLSWLAASVSVLFRDIPTLIGVALGVTFYLTPVFYGLRIVPDRYEWLLHLNPLTTLIEAYRWALLDTPAPSVAAFAAVSALAAVICVGGLLVFRRLELSFADHL